MQSQRRQRVYVIVTGFMAFLMIASAILPSISQNQSPIVQPQAEPTEIPVPTFAPPPSIDTINFDQKYLHPSGLFTVAQPSGWASTRDSNNGTHVQVNFNNDPAKSVIETYIEKPSEPIETLDELSAHFSQEDLESSWRNYSSPTETGRFIDKEKERVLIDFELTLGRQTYLARHVAQIKDGWIYVTRVVTPNNARDLLLFLVDQLPPTIERVELFAEAPTEEIAWSAYYSLEDNLIIRYPNGWAVADGGPGEPVSIEGNNGEVLRIETIDDMPIDSEDAARSFVEGLRTGISVVSVEPTTRNGGEGFQVAYNLKTLEGENQNGIAVLLNDENGTLYVANARANGDPADLNNPGDDLSFQTQNLIGTIDSFNLTTGINLPNDGEIAS